jgi:hypothetical protein
MGYIVRGPLAGPTWHHLQYVLGLRDLGHDVWYLEDSDDFPMCYDPERQEVGTDARYGLAYATRVFERLGLGDRWAYHDGHAGRWEGPLGRRMEDVAKEADVLLNVSGVNPLRPWVEGVSARVMIDTDPVFTQIDFIEDASKRARALAHQHFFTFGECIGRPSCSMPDDELPWRPTRQPVALRAWPVAPPRPEGLYTTVMLWDSYDPREYRGRHFGMKALSMEAVFDFPLRLGRRFELTLGGLTSPTQRLLDAGWLLRDPIATTRDPCVYQKYMHTAKAEFSVAKHGYVVSGSGWFSERSCGYLASGRPVVTQDTGFSAVIPVGDGLLAWHTPEEAVAAIAEVEARYAHHCSAARQVVEAHFDARLVLASLLDAVSGAQAPVPSDST